MTLTRYEFLPNPNWKLVRDFILSADASSFDIEELDLVHGQSYYIHIYSIFALSAADNVQMYINDETTDTKYYNQRSMYANTTMTAARNNRPTIYFNYNNSETMWSMCLQLSTTGKMCAYTTGTMALGSAVAFQGYTTVANFTVSQITKLTFKTLTTGVFAAGTRLKIYKVET